jgi:nucleotide-binding universal stress UspA family protein
MILAGFNPATGATEPVEFGLAASGVTGAPLVVAVIRSGDDDEDDRTLAGLRAALSGREVAVDVREYRDVAAGSGLVSVARQLSPELVVVGTTSRGSAGAALLGTTAERVVHRSSCPVAVVPHDYRRPAGGVRTIGAAYAPTPEGREALRAAARLARLGSARVRAFRVLEGTAPASQGLMARQHHEIAADDDERARAGIAAEDEFADAVAQVAGGAEVELDVLVNDPADGLLAAARGVDLLVMGSRAFGPRRAVLLGSVSRKVTERAPCPVLIVPRGAEDRTEQLLAHAEGQSR